MGGYRQNAPYAFVRLAISLNLTYVFLSLCAIIKKRLISLYYLKKDSQ